MMAPSQRDAPAPLRPASARAHAERRGVRDGRVLDALDRVSRARFVAPELAEAALLDRPLPVEEGQSTPAPGVVAQLLEALAVRPGERVLEVGTGNGYTAALLAALGTEVFTVERLPALAGLAEERLRGHGDPPVRVRHGDGFAGWSDHAPFDAVLVSAATREVPAPLLEQLRVGGRLVVPAGPHRAQQRLVRLTRQEGGQVHREDLGPLRFVSLLGDILVELGSVRRDDAERAARAARRSDRPIGTQLLAEGLVQETDLYRALAIQRGMRFGGVGELLSDADPAVVGAVSRAFLEHNRVIPLAKKDDRLLVATCDPDAHLADLAKAYDAHGLVAHLVTPTDYRRLWAALDLREEEGAAPAPVGRPIAPRDDLLARHGDSDAHAVALFDAVLLEAIGERASDIHYEIYGERVRVRLRVDGELRDLEHVRMTPTDLKGVINVLKISADMDIAERRLPQGGRMRRRAGDQVYDLRVQTQPSLHGEHAVIRLLPQKQRLLSIAELGFAPDVGEDYRRLLDSPAGLLLVVGPTGSGKSTTLYAGLQVLARQQGRKVITVEDPIEYSIEGIQQTQVKPAIGFHFHDAMRSFVREDPDVILVGEIRDQETALEALRASQTGHLVLSTLHSNDTVDAVQRLIDLEMHPNSIAGELLAVIAQRLAKRICDGCRRAVEPDPEILAELFPAGPPEGFRAFRGDGCARCGDHGTYDRIAVVEYLRVGAELRRAIARKLPVDDIRETALRAGLRSMRDRAVQLVQQGIVPLEELPRILPAERMAETAGGPLS